jgi:tetratricopeptide (TPR) repeat protein
LLTFSSFLVTDILAGQTQQYSDDAEGASDVLFALRDRIPKDEPIWLASVDNALANMFLRQGEWRLALGSLDRMMELVPAATESELRSTFSNSPNAAEIKSLLITAYKCEILSRQGRALLQVGALPQVAQVFEWAKTLWDQVESRIPSELANHNVVKLVPSLMEANGGLYYFAKSNFELAIQSFSAAVEKLREQGNLTPKYRSEDWMGPTVAGSESPNILYSECINNLSLCCLYTCRMKDAIQFLEGVVREDPTSFLTERVAFNLCTLYELGSDSAASARLKRVLQLIAKRFFLHDVGPESFRVT